jgi:hypothetical protein
MVFNALKYWLLCKLLGVKCIEELVASQLLGVLVALQPRIELAVDFFVALHGHC